MVSKIIKEKIIKYGKKMVAEDLTTGTGGNLSVNNTDTGLIAITPSGIPYKNMTPEDIVITNMDGKIVEGERKPSSELSLHRRIYESRDDIEAVIHTHSTFATVVACMGEELPPVHYLIAAAGGEKVPIADYARYGSEELAEKATVNLGKNYQAVLLANHGLLTAGKSLTSAFEIAETIEFVAEIYCKTKNMGAPQILTKKQMEKVRSSFESYGQQK